MRLRKPAWVVMVTIALGIGLSLASVGLAQNELIKKPFHQWTKAEATKVLNESPWAVTQEARIDFGREVRKIAGAPVVDGAYLTAELGGANIAVDYRVTLRLRSALPIRKAIVRLRQIEAKYDQMSEKDREVFDAKTKGLLDCPGCVQNYVITLSCKSMNYPGADCLYEGLRGATLPGIKPYIHILNDRGDERELIHFMPPKGPNEESILFFQRFDDEDRPLLTASSKKLIFRLSDNNAKAITNFEIDVSKLILDGKIEF